MVTATGVDAPRRLRAGRLPAAAALALAVALASALPAQAQKFGKNKITYNDFDWHVYKAPHFDVYYYPEEEAFLEQVVSYAESAYVTISQALAHEIRFRIPLIYYKTHGEFEQTNIILSFIPEAVGAFAEPTLKRMVLPIDQPPNELYALILHELTHIFEYSILFQDAVGREVRGNPPLWLMEGLASYLASDEDSFDLMFLRDAVVNGLMPKLEQLTILHFLTYRYGHAIFDFITQEFGKEGLRNFLLEFRKVLLTQNIEKAIKEAFGWEVEEFERRFHKYLRQKYLPALLEKDEPADYGEEVATKESRKRQDLFFSTFSPTIAPSGELIAALTTRYDDLDVAIFSAKDGEIVRNLTKGFTTDYEHITIEFLHGKKDLAWSPDGDRVAFFARKGNRQPLFIYHAVTGKKLAEIEIAIDKLASPSFSPDGREIAFSGNREGVVDIYAIHLKTRQIRNLTQDEFYDTNPSWSADGKQVLYNRRLKAYEKVFMVDSGDPTRKTQLTFGDTRDIQPSFSADGKFVYYASDYGREGIYNIYSLELADGTVRRYTDVLGGNFTPVELNVDTAGRRTVAFASFFKQRFQIYKMVLGEPLQVFKPGQPPEPPEPRRVKPPAPKSAAAREVGEVGPAPLSRRGGRSPREPWSSGGGLDLGLAAAARRALTDGRDALAFAAEGGAPAATEAETFEPPLKLKIDESEKSRYTNKKWSVEGSPDVLFGVADDGTLISDSTIIFSDLLGDYRHFLRLRSVSSFTDFDYAFVNLKRRTRWIVHLFDSRDYFVVGQTSGGTDRRQAQRTTGAEFSVVYPFSFYHRISGALGYFDRTQQLPFLRDTGGVFEVDFIETKERFPRLTTTFTGDTTIFRSFGAYHGRRYDFTFQYAPIVTGVTTGLDEETRDATSFFNYFIDFRNYWSWSRRSLFAVRAQSAVSNGSGSDIFSFGGFNTLRGFDFREFFGTRVAFLNLELRFPLIDELRFPFGSIRQIRALVFLDVGAGWFSGGEACDLTDATGAVVCGLTGGGSQKHTRRRVFDDEAGEFREFDFWDSREHRLRDGRASAGLGFNFYFGPFELNWVFSQIAPYIEVDPITGDTHRANPRGTRMAFYIGRKF